jgi:hypothetical protein
MQITCWGISLFSLSRWRERVGVRVVEVAHVPLILALSSAGRGDCRFPKRFPENALGIPAVFYSSFSENVSGPGWVSSM